MTAPAYIHEESRHDVVVVGGGMAGIAAAVTAARLGASACLVQDRPVLGGNASTEIRVNLEGANGGVHNRFFVESGLAEDLLLENLWRNPTSSADHWSALLLDLVLGTDGLDLYLDTHAHAVDIDSRGLITAVRALTLASERAWTFRGDVFVDATGDATIAYLAEADFMYGEEAREAFGEPLAPPQPTDDKLGGTMQFMCKDVGRPVIFEPPAFARKVTADELRVNRAPNLWSQEPVLGGFWWIEYGGHLDTVHDNEDIKLMLLAELYGVWDYVKNSPEWRERNVNLDLEWVAAMPGKRESRRVIGDHVLTEHDVVGSTRFDDAVAFGGWSLDRHAPLGFMDFDTAPCTQVHPPGVYQIPLRSLYARNVPNLYLAGRDISTSHVACCSSRVMLTCAHGGEAVGAAAALTTQTGRGPRELAADRGAVGNLRAQLEALGHYIPFVPLTAGRLSQGVRATASSETPLAVEDIETTVSLEWPRLLSLPLVAPRLESVSVWVKAPESANLDWRLHAADRGGGWLPGELISTGRAEAPASEGSWIEIPIGVDTGSGYVHLALATDDARVELGASLGRPYGPLSWRSHIRDAAAVAVDRREQDRWSLPQIEEKEWSDSFAFPFSYWRRDAHGWGGPPGPTIAFRTDPVQAPATAIAVLEPWERPTTGGVHGWATARQPGLQDEHGFLFDVPQWLAVELAEPIDVDALELVLNSDVDRHLANLWYSHPSGFRAIPTLLRDFDVSVVGADGAETVVANIRRNHARRCRVTVGGVIRGFSVTVRATNGEPYASIADLRLWPASQHASPTTVGAVDADAA